MLLPYKKHCAVFDSFVRLVVTMIMGSVLRGRVLNIDLCMWTRNGARTLPVVLDRDQWCGNCNHRIIKDGVDYCPQT